MTNLPPPRGWGPDALTQYFDSYRRNQFATFFNKQQPLADLVQIDALFCRFFDGAINPCPIYPMGFMLRAHSAYRAGVGCVMGGQIYESQAMFRLCLEHAAYGFFIDACKCRWNFWLHRSDSVEDRKEFLRRFRNEKIQKYIESKSSSLGRQYDDLYAWLIDFGAHPNEQGYALNTKLTSANGDNKFDTIYLQGDGQALDMGIRTARQVGLWALDLMQQIYPERCKLLSIGSELDTLRKRNNGT